MKSQSQKLINLKEDIEGFNDYVKLLGNKTEYPKFYIDINESIKFRHNNNVLFEMPRSDREYSEFLVNLTRLTIK